MPKVLLWLHIAFAIFTIGPVTATTMATPRYIRAKDANVVRYLHRSTRIFAIGTLGAFLFGALLGGSDLARPYLSVSMTLFVVALVLLVIIDRDQRTAVRTLSAKPKEGETPTAAAAPDHAPDLASDLASDLKVQTARIATLAGVVSLIWLVILVLMIWF
ncbi:hypothetical protein SAMN05421505_112210 [Sinosporangium album]|uniref:DUF2269 family protein n=1 Tax=Sinosporangium album TaxID=504805 RepID=A0A1G8AL42_9ACTN|nr:hypothetical protein [Sinosporangium album]SDH21674.1 hypothetical protein SAMN05421505_112210 [Sinosporangium album]